MRLRIRPSRIRRAPHVTSHGSCVARIEFPVVTAAVFSDAAHIVEEIALLKTRTSGATRTAAAANPIE